MFAVAVATVALSLVFSGLGVVVVAALEVSFAVDEPVVIFPLVVARTSVMAALRVLGVTFVVVFVTFVTFVVRETGDGLLVEVLVFCFFVVRDTGDGLLVEVPVFCFFLGCPSGSVV